MMLRRLSHISDTSSNQHSYRAELLENTEDFQIVWLDARIDGSSDSLTTRTLLSELNSAAQFYQNLEMCENFIQRTHEKKILFIISGAYTYQGLVKLASIRSIRAIFIFCQNRSKYHDIAHQQPKIIGIFTNHKSLLKSIQKTMHRLEKQSYVFNLFNQKQKSTTDLSREGAAFMWHQLLIHALRQMVNDEHAKSDMLKKCLDYYQHSKKELANIERFRSSYSSDEAIYWYTIDSFIYRLLNKAFRTENIELIYAFRYFVIDLCAQLETESLKSKDKGALTVYRGQQIPNEEFEKLQQSIGKLIAANGFFSASREKEVSIIYAGESSDEMTAVLFEIQADSSLRSITLADIHQISEFTEEQEVLFSLGATFHIDSIVFDAKLSLWKVQLKSTDDGWERVQEYLQLAEDEMKDTSPMIYFGSLLLHELGQVEQAEKYFRVLLKTLPSDHVDIAALKIGLGHIHTKRGDYRLALQEYEQAYKIRQDKLSVLHPRIATSLLNFGNTYRVMGDFDQALFYFREAMKINERNYLTDHICVAMTFEEIALTFQGKTQWETALVWFEDALEIFKRILPSQHPQIAQCLGHIGNSYRYMKQFDCALEYLHRELEMDELCLPSNHGHVFNDLSRIVDTYRAMHAYDQGLKFCQEKLAMYQELYGENHPRFVNTLLRIVSLLLDKPSINKALRACQRALAIVTNLVPANISIAIESLEYISHIYQLRGELDESLNYRQQQLECEKKIHPVNHRNVGRLLVCIGTIHYETRYYTVALNHFYEALAVYESIHPQDNDMINSVREQIMRCEKAQERLRKSRKTSLTRFPSSSGSRSRSRSGYRSSSAIVSDRDDNLVSDLKQLNLKNSNKKLSKPKLKRKSRKKSIRFRN